MSLHSLTCLEQKFHPKLPPQWRNNRTKAIYRFFLATKSLLIKDPLRPRISVEIARYNRRSNRVHHYWSDDEANKVDEFTSGQFLSGWNGTKLPRGRLSVSCILGVVSYRVLRKSCKRLANTEIRRGRRRRPAQVLPWVLRTTVPRSAREL